MRTDKTADTTVTYHITPGAPRSADRATKKINALGCAKMKDAAICQQCINANQGNVGQKSKFSGKPIGKESARNQNMAAKVSNIPHSAG